MEFMHCNSCKTLVQVNATGICLGCQMGFAGPQEDAWIYHKQKEVEETHEEPPVEEIKPTKALRKRKKP